MPRLRLTAAGELVDADAPRRRPSRHTDPARRFYSTYRWQKTSKRQLWRQPFCEDAGLGGCEGPLCADRIVPVSRGGEPFDFDNLTTRCRRHNSARRSNPA